MTVRFHSILTRFAWSLILWAGLCGGAMAQLVEIDPAREVTPLGRDLRYWGSIDPDPGAALRAFRAGEFQSEMVTARYGVHYAPETWAATELRNTALPDGRAGDAFVLTMDAPAVSGVRLFLVRDSGLTETLLDYSVFEPFDHAEHAVTRLRTSELLLAPGEQVTLLAHVQHGPFTTFTLSLRTPLALNDAVFVWGIGLSAFYAFALCCIVFFFGFQFAMRNRLGAWNAVLFLAFLALIAFVDGLFFRFAYPNVPQAQSMIGFFILFALSGLGFLVAGAGLPRGSGLARVISAMAALSGAGYLLALAQPGPVAITLAYGLIALMLVANVLVAWHVRHDKIAPNVGVVAVSGFAVAGAVLVIALALWGKSGTWLDAPAALRIVFALLLTAVMTALTVNVMALRRRQLAAVKDRLRAVEAEAERSRELLDAERNYVRARELASVRQRQLATASHDLKQPLFSLRMTFDTIASEMQPAIRERLKEAFDYLEGLANGYVDSTMPSADQDLISADDETAESYALHVPLATVAQMFEGEALSKGVALRVVASSVETTAPPLVLMRILTNLVSNAIKYTETGGVVVGVRRAGGPAIFVCDSGPGLDPDEIERFRKPYEKGTASGGHGLGLSVCFELAERNDMRLTVTSVKGQGTCFALSMAQHQT